ncbi:MAG: arginine--tRNA ligase [Phycisphaeraceae bacterium]|nr:arginine--tRNA ligase [Phycisphaeraceae bacterium]
MPDTQHLLETILTDALAAALPDQVASLGPVDPLVRPTTNAQLGDYQANLAMSLAKRLGQKPRDLAQAIADKLPAVGGGVIASAVVAGPGFINLRLTDDSLTRQAAAAADDPRLGVEPAANPQTVVLDYSAPNVAKEMQVHHIRSTGIGDALARVLGHLGHRVIRQNHLGDWGTQFGMLLEHLLDQGWTAESSRPIEDLNALYRQAKARFDAEPDFAERARRRVVALQAGDPTSVAIWKGLIEESLKHFRAIYARLGVLLTDEDLRGESYYNDMLADTVEELRTKGLAVQSQGALCVFPPGFLDRDGNPAAMIIRKSDGGYLYATTDLATLRHSVDVLKGTRLAYVTDARQAQHFAMVFKTAELAGWLGNGISAEHVPFGTVLGKDNKPFKTRDGGTVKLSDLLDEAEVRALKIIEEKNPDLPEPERKQIAHAVGIGALKYADLCNDRVKDYVFDWDRMLSFDGNTAPYLQNAFVRIQAIFRKGNLAPKDAAGAAIPVADPAERALVLKLLQWPVAVRSVADALEPHRLCNYLYELASLFHQFYEHCPVLGAPDPALRQGRLRLCDLTARTIQTGLGLLGIAAPARM